MTLSKGFHQKNKRLKFGHCPNRGEGGDGPKSEPVKKSLLGGKSHHWEKKVIAGRKMYCAYNDPIHPENH